MFKILFVMCVVGSADKCAAVESQPMFESHEQCAAYVASESFKTNDVPFLTQRLSVNLGAEDGAKMKWQVDCKPA